MRLRLVAPRQGLAWIRQAFGVFFRQPLVFTALFFAVYFALLVLSILPPAGPFLASLVVPAVTLGFMIATRKALDGRAPMPGVFIAPFRNGRACTVAMLQLGVAYTLAFLLIVVVADWIDGGSVGTLMGDIDSSESTREAMDDPRVQTGLVIRLALLLPLAMVFWHAPALVYWHGLPAPKALFFSIVACWRNKVAFLAYVLGWAGLLLALTLVVSLLAAVLNTPQVVPLIVFPAVLTFATTFQISLYFAFADCFEPAEATDLPAPRGDGPA